MYRQPENSNRVKSMKSRFEGLNVPNSSNDKTKRSLVRNTVNSATKSTVTKANNLSNKIHDKQKLTLEYNNNDYKTAFDTTRLGSAKENYNVNRMKSEDSCSTRKDNLEDKTADKDFSDVNKKELCNVPPLNLTRQLNDPSKKGCIKRTPAFRKEKFVNSRIKQTADDLNFANIVKLFENNDKLISCDEVGMTCSDNSGLNAETKVDANEAQFAPKKRLTSTVSHPVGVGSKPSLGQKQKLSSSASLALNCNDSGKNSPVSRLRKISLNPGKGDLISADAKVEDASGEVKENSISIKKLFVSKSSSVQKMPQNPKRQNLSQTVRLKGEENDSSKTDSHFKESTHLSPSNISGARSRKKSRSPRREDSASLIKDLIHSSKSSIIARGRKKSRSPRRRNLLCEEGEEKHVSVASRQNSASVVKELIHNLSNNKLEFLTALNNSKNNTSFGEKSSTKRENLPSTTSPETGEKVAFCTSKQDSNLVKELLHISSEKSLVTRNRKKSLSPKRDVNSVTILKKDEREQNSDLAKELLHVSPKSKPVIWTRKKSVSPRRPDVSLGKGEVKGTPFASTQDSDLAKRLLDNSPKSKPVIRARKKSVSPRRGDTSSGKGDGKGTPFASRLDSGLVKELTRINSKKGLVEEKSLSSKKDGLYSAKSAKEEEKGSFLASKLESSSAKELVEASSEYETLSRVRKKSWSPQRQNLPSTLLVENTTFIENPSLEKDEILVAPKQDSIPLVKELIHNLSNNEHESLVKEIKITDANLKASTSNIDNPEESSSKTPAYAQVVKPKKKVVLSESADAGLTDTLKAALRQPLPSGPPPKKPPRTFAHTPNAKSQEGPTSKTSITTDSEFCDRLNDSLAQGLRAKSPESDKKPLKIKSDPKLMLQKLENALLNNKIRSPKLPRKLKSVDASPKSSRKPLVNQEGTQSNLYTTETPQKNLFPNCLPSLNCVSIASNTYAKIAPVKLGATSMSTFFTESKGEEPIYAEPFVFPKENEPKGGSSGKKRGKSDHSDNRADTLTNSLHYMSNPVCDQHWNLGQSDDGPAQECVDGSDVCNKSVSNPKDCESEPLNRHKLNLIMNHIYASPTPSDSDIDSLPSTPSSGDTSSRRNTIRDLIQRYEEKHKLESASLNIPSSVKQRLNHVERSSGGDGGRETEAAEVEAKSVSEMKSTSETEPSSEEERKKYKAQLNRTLTDIRKTYVRRMCSTLKRKSDVKDEHSHLFECCLLVGLNVSDSTPYIKNKYPNNYNVPEWVPHLCFPDATDWTPETHQSQDCQCYSLVITNEHGDRKFGYCRRVLPEETSVCLPLTYCIISSFRATGFYHKVLRELESRHGLPFWLQDAFVRELYNCKFPQPGESVKVSCLLRTLVIGSCKEMVLNQQVTTPENVECVKRLVNMQNGAYGCLNKGKRDSGSECGDWVLLGEAVERESTKSDLEDSDKFRIPKNTYGSSPSNNPNETSFAKITKYSKEFRRCTSDSPDYIIHADLLRPKNPNTSFIHHRHNDRSSEPQINKRLGQIFDNINVKPNDDNVYEDVSIPNSQTDITSANSVDNKISVADSRSSLADSKTSVVDYKTLSEISESFDLQNSVNGYGDFNNIHTSALNLSNNQLLYDCLLGDVDLKRPYDSRLEDVDLTVLFNTLDLGTLLQTFGSLLLERKVIFVSSCLSKLSSCIEALQSILYPFSWQHTFIPVLSSNMLFVLSAPVPLIAGVLATHLNEAQQIEEGITVNLDTSAVVCSMGDENNIIPKRLQRGLASSLQLVTGATGSEDSSRNVLVSDAFIRMFVELCGCYKQFISTDSTGKKNFERESFVKHHKSHCVNLFLEWFTETAMFCSFIQTRLEGEPSESIFEMKCLEFNCDRISPALVKNSKVTQKMKHFGQKLFH